MIIICLFVGLLNNDELFIPGNQATPRSGSLGTRKQAE